jgi:hypothetical protein
MNELKDRYLQLFPEKGISNFKITKIEKRLSIKIPQDLKEILTYYAGYSDIASLSLFSFLEDEIGWNVCDKTEEFRKLIKLPNKYLVLKEGDESFIVLETKNDQEDLAPIYWIGISDVQNLIEEKPLLDNPTIFQTFAEFFEYLLEEEEKMRNGE